MSDLVEPPAPKLAEHLLVETIRQVGVSNYSLIARLTGLNPETVRYKVNKQLGKLGLSVQINLDYVQLGFSMFILTVKAHSAEGRSWLDHVSYLKFVGKQMGTDRYLCVSTIPYRFKKKYSDSLASLQQSGLIDQFEASEVSWVRYPPLRSQFFDFREGCWSIDWGRLGTMQKELGATSLFPANTDCKVDYLDVQILKAIQEDPTTNPAKIAKQLGANPRTVRYHYLEHIVKGKYILDNNVRWSGSSSHVEKSSADLMQVVFSFRNLDQDEISATRKICNMIPFTWLEAGTTDRAYHAILDIPTKSFHESIRFIEGRTEGVRDRLEMLILDPARTHSYNIPEEMYDADRGWRLFTESDFKLQQQNQLTATSAKERTIGSS